MLVVSIVTLSSSADSLCPGDGVVFTCVTDTGRLVWDINDDITQAFYSPAELNSITIASDIFTIVLYNITGELNNVFHSSISAVHVPIAYNGATIRCSDQLNSSEKVIVLGMLNSCLKYFTFQHSVYRASSITTSQFSCLL